MNVIDVDQPIESGVPGTYVDSGVATTRPGMFDSVQKLVLSRETTAADTYAAVFGAG